MPNIDKPFAKTGVACYKCGKDIPHGSYNWSYNTHARGAFAHKNCTVAPPPPPQVKIPVATPDVKITATPRGTDITDLIKINDKHFATKLIQCILSERQYPFLHGSPGAGKTHLVKSLAEDMGLPFLLVSCASDMLKSELLGSRSPVSGAYFESKFRSLWQNGGLVLFDECGLAPGSFLNVLNAAMEQRLIDFPDGAQVKMHENFFMCFADNSTLYGNDPMFPERGDVGGAFRDRLTYVEFAYDLDIELAVLTAKFDGNAVLASDWHQTVLRLRHGLKSLEIPVFASPRFAYKAATWMKRRVEMRDIVKMELLRGVSEDLVKLAVPVIERYLEVRL